MEGHICLCKCRRDIIKVVIEQKAIVEAQCLQKKMKRSIHLKNN